MATQVQFRRGTTAQNDSFSGAAGEISINSDIDTIRVHDGSTQGGFELPKGDLSNTKNVGVLTATTFDGNVTGNVTGNIDGIVGGTTPAAGTFTTLVTTGDVDLGNATSDTITATGRFDSDLVPSADGTRSLGTSSLEWQDLYIDGTANIDSLVADTADINGGTIDGATIGGSSAGAITGTTITANTGFTGDVTGNADTATTLATSRTLSISGAGTGSASFNGSGDADIALTLANSGVTAATYGSSSAIPIVTVDAKGLITSATTTSIDSTTISNGSASVAVAADGPITSNANHDFSAGIDVTGNITVSGTVDGRDIATDGSKLDGIASGATNVTNNNQLTNGANYITASSNITGTAAGLSGSPNITVTDITAVGDVSITGTLTYEDVNNVDSIGLVTARTGVRVTAGGIEVSNGGAAITGVTTVTGNIVVSGTVDGRDVATDGTKLDGIEASADVTDATNVAAAGAVMESDTSTSNMSFVVDEDNMSSNSATKIPTQQSVKAYVDSTTGAINTELVNDTTPQLGGTLDTNGNVIDFGDCASNNTSDSGDDRLRFGASQDLQIYHVASSNSYIDNFSQHIYIRNNVDGDDGGNIYIQAKSGEHSIICNDDSSVNLYYDSDLKLQTVSGGVDVTGNITVSGTVDGRDIATDGTKLDGIEANATADQTASEILTLIKTVDGVGSGLDADKLDGYSGESYLRSNASDQFTAGTLRFNDDIILAFGTQTDAEVFHNGTDLYLDLNLGNFYIRDSTTTRFTFDDAGHFTATGNITASSFIGDVTGDVTGNVTGNATGLSGSPSITVTDITASGDVSITGTLTYEDVTNVDSVGLVTARTGVRVTAGGIEVSNGGLSVTGVTTVTGNITVSGTVDGRDVATDGSKLDGIASGAISDIVSDTSPQLGGTLDTNGNVIDFGDSSGTTDDRLRFGAGQDLQIWHNGANSYITQYSDVGDLYINCHNDDNDVIIQTDNGSGSTTDYFRADGSTGEAKLFHYGSEKIKTASGGVDVTGNITVSGTVDGRDIATDGSKLDGIASGATNVTNNNQLTNGAGYITSADGGNAATLDGIDSSSFLRSDASDVKTSGDLTFMDNIAANFGSGADAELLCNGSHFYLKLGSSIGNFYIQDGSTTRFTFDDAGHFTATGDINSSSDIRLKTNIKTLTNSLDRVLQMRGVEYDRIDLEGKHQIGVIAQEVEEVAPELVSVSDDDGMKSVSYGNITAILIEAMKEQQEQIEQLKQEINELKGES